jgi:broad specificity phosphatase PhoE
MIVKQTPQRFANDPRRSETLQARAAELSEKQRESVIAGIQRLVKYEPRPRALFSSPLSSPVSTSQSAAAAAASPQRPQLTIQQLRDARNAYFGVGQQQRQNEQPPPPESSGGGKRKYSRKKNNSKKSKFRRRYSKKYKY